MNDFAKYQESLNNIIQLKRDLNEAIGKRHLYKNELRKAVKKEKILREELMKLIPNNLI